MKKTALAMVTSRTVACIALSSFGILTATVGMGQSSIDLQALRDTALAKHNEYRSKHAVQPLESDATLVQDAQNYAEKLAKQNNGKSHETADWDHDKQELDAKGQGENLAYYVTTGNLADNLGEEAVKDWYDEIKDYDFSNPGQKKPGSENEMIGHFTQVVWKSSTRLGCGAATTENFTYNGKKAIAAFVVCRYSSRGNYIGQYKENVLPPQG